MSEDLETRRARKARAVRLVLSQREKAPRSPKMERALKRLIWRYVRPSTEEQENDHVQE